MDPIWLRHYPPGIPQEIHYQGETLQDLFIESCQKFAQRPAYTFMRRCYSFADTARLALQFASFCRSHLKLQKGDRLAVMLPNCLHYPIAVFGGLMAGLTIVNLNPLDKSPSLKHELSDSGAKALVVIENFMGQILPILDQTTVTHVVVARMGDFQPWPLPFFINAYLRYIKRKAPSRFPPHYTSFQKALTIGAALPSEKIPVHADDLAFIQYTGGTTGIAKGVMLSHKNIMSNVLQCCAWAAPVLKEGQERVITALPLYHIFSLMVNNFIFLKVGGESVLIADARDIPHLIKVMKKYPPSCFTGVNTLFNALLRQDAFKKLDFSKLKMSIAGGMAAQTDVAEAWQNITGCVLCQGYGLSEASPVVCMNPFSIKNFNGSVGFPLPSTRVAICNEQGEELKIGETGELCVQGPQVMQGYWHREAETQHALRPQSWLRTADAAYVDKNGFVFIVDRLKDMLIVSGFKVYPTEVENFIKTLPGVNEVAVIGIPSVEHGQTVKAVIVKDKKSSLSAEEVIRHCHEQLVGYKCPTEVEFRDTLPKSNVGKILKRELLPNTVSKDLNPPAH